MAGLSVLAMAGRYAELEMGLLQYGGGQQSVMVVAVLANVEG